MNGNEAASCLFLMELSFLTLFVEVDNIMLESNEGEQK